ncbi:single-strand binding protein [Desulfonispora thiosulfatigenes DSM 11270]|uniref:Single-stranded DNA-binding protein n=1 Tax=Desulfonispora thiosulfatigenes DSM 11270 TaxID=656914 RepID=A0A1W1V2Y9_DESTI|nr:single-stranded DNA-binding protein [Desulfonispora thiosulfatigenes]SMB87695.1 single-strand binding protein [Desulfonispora thiosulfatigenes DSM 11270]
MNKIILIGRLTKDPELRFTPSGKGVATFTLAVNRPFANQQGEREADFIQIVVWGKPAENCANFIGKGSQVAIDGRLQVRTYDNKEGQKRWVTEVVANSVEFLDSRGKRESNRDNNENNNNQEDSSFGTVIDFSEDDIPF